MKSGINSLIISFLVILWGMSQTAAGQKDTAWTLQDCINYALQQNVQVCKSELTTETNRVNLALAKAQRFPSLSASVGQNFAWSKMKSSGTTAGSFSGYNSTSFDVNSSVTLYNGFKTTNNIRQADLNYQAGKYDAEATKESISLSVMDAYLEVLYEEEQVRNCESQVKSTSDQLGLAAERLALRAIAQSDYLQVKSQLATEKQSLAEALSQLAIARVTLMQLMELPVNDKFTIAHPDINTLISQIELPIADTIYQNALTFKPEIQSIKLKKEVSQLNVDIARAGMKPTLSMNAGIGTGYSSQLSGMGYGDQLNNKISPSVGLTLSIPIYQRREVKSAVEIAGIDVKDAELDQVSAENTLRKSIEQACVDVVSAEREYEASKDGYDAALESYKVAEEKFNQGMINSVDFVVQKTNLVSSESTLLQSKYNLIFSYKTLDFYKGVPLTL